MESKFIEHIFTEGLISIGKRLEEPEKNTNLQLNRNESPFDFEDEIKNLIYLYLSKKKWNRYPPIDNSHIEKQIANYCGVDYEKVVAGPGSANLITSLLNYFAINKKKLHIASPSFSLYEYHCKTYNIPYLPWLLNKNLEYDIKNLKGLSDQSVVLFASPNNPIGNILPVEDLEYLSKNNPKSLFIIDEVYAEYSDISYLELLKNSPNIVSIGSFSKTLSAAGVRLGYIIADKQISNQIRKLILPFSLNLFTLAFAETILQDKTLLKISKTRLEKIISERERVYSSLTKEGYNYFFSIKKPYGNFLFIKFLSDNYFNQFLTCTIKNNISILNLSNTPLLENSVRITIGKSDENDKIIACFEDFLPS